VVDPVEKRKKEEGLVKDLLESPVWAWLKPVLEGERDTLVSVAADPRLTPESRALACGRLGLVVDILTRPSRILNSAERTKELLIHNPRRKVAPQVTPS
jgi:hypothetical protein